MINAVTEYGCQAVVGFDNSAALQAAIDEASASGNAQTVYLPGATHAYQTWKPIRIYKNGVTLCGDGPEATVLQLGGGHGPVLVCAPTVSLMGAPPIVTDSVGAAYTFDGTNSYAYDLGMDYGIDLNNLSQFCVEAFINPGPAIPGGPNILVSSMGRRLSTEPVTCAFSIGTQGATGGQGTILATLNVGGQSYSLDGGLISVGQAYHIALSYDGSAIRLFVTPLGNPGVLAASSTASGNLSQALTEDVIFGPPSQDWPYCNTLASSFVGNVYCLRISNLARYTAAGFTLPSIPLGTGPNSLICLNASWPVYDMFIQSTTASYIPVRWLKKVTVGSVAYHCLKDIGIGGLGGVSWQYTQNSLISNVHFKCNGRFGLHAWNNCFNNTLSDVQCYAGARIGIAASLASWAWASQGKLFINGGLYQLVLANGSLNAQDLDFQPSPVTHDVALFKAVGGNSTLTAGAISIDAESGEGSLYLDSQYDFKIGGGSIYALTKVPLVINSGQAGLIEGTDFRTSANSMISIPNAPVNPIALLGCNKPTNAAWADNLNSVRVL